MSNISRPELDNEIASFRSLQEAIQKLKSDEQQLLGQHSENEMVKQELGLLDQDANVFKKVGPVLMKVEFEDARQTVQKRLEFISGELSKLSANIKESELKCNAQAEKIQKIHGAMQASAVEAAQQIAQQNAIKS